ncbi:hypothetical protein [Diaphorobacter nitroreducens]|uniref:hypothetical protein n=1 Tax=Diaphorobacter nitroreducens TaxID=164759 RepID=UPI001E4E842C|nr:hypothetical protein [Diaphorobacter nitroreducens]
MGALPVTDVVEDGLPCVLSFWKPDAAEMAAINGGGLVMLSIVGRTMPPVAVHVTKPEAR